MNRPVAHKARRYTLVEILVAMAILVIMMSFLFQFVIGAQRIWSASTRTASVFDKAQIVFDVLETDLKNAQFSDEPGREMPFYVRKLSGTTSPIVPSEMVGTYCGMFTNTSSTGTTGHAIEAVGTYPVLTYFINQSAKIYRCAIDKEKYKLSDESEITIPNWYLFGSGFSQDFFGEFAKTFLPSNADKVDELADGVEDIVIQPLFRSGVSLTNGYAPERPTAVKITLTLYDPEADKLEGAAVTTRRDETRRVFTKIIFMQ